MHCLSNAGDRLACLRSKTVAELLAAGGGHAGPNGKSVRVSHTTPHGYDLTRKHIQHPMGTNISKRNLNLNHLSMAIIMANRPSLLTPGSGNPVLDCGIEATCVNNFGPTADGVLFNQTAWQLLTRGEVAGVTPGSNFSVMAGTCTNDGSLFAVGYYDSINASLYENFLAVLLTKNARVMGRPLADPKDVPEATIAKAISLYPPSRATDPAVELKQNQARLSVAITDANFACPTRFIVDRLTASADIGTRAWLYRFDHNVTFASPCAGQWDKAYGNASHTAELPFVFGRPLAVFGPQSGPPCVFSGAEKILARDVGRFWSSLAADGSPGTEWPPWTSRNRPTTRVSDGDVDFVLDTKLPGPGERVEHGWDAGARCDFWLDPKWLPPAAQH